MTSTAPPSEAHAALRSWTLTGIVATLVIVLSLPLYILKERFVFPTNERSGHETLATFAGSEACRDCHRPQYDRWKNSHHDMAMDVATDATVRGDFNNVTFEHDGIVSRFYRKEGRYFVHTQGPKGAMADFEITHTFGVEPLQQYLVPFPGGRMQCLPIAWDVRQNRWYHLYPGSAPEPDDWLYWTNAGQNWNGMCAECHSTNLKKNYDPDTGAYATTWADIDVGCEACHGPGSRHIAWARLPEMARPKTADFDLVVNSTHLPARQQIELCAPCHSRRSSLGDNTHDFDDFLDYAMPQLLTEGMYYPDGQILEEVYVYGSFMQSKMYNRDIRCSDCHDVHSTRRVKEGNALCLQCHRADVYDTAAHHFHKKAGEKGDPIKGPDSAVLFEVGSGASCEQCHMPGRVYMGIDYRPDHSFRVPRPDLTAKTGAPNACSRCHWNKSYQWAQDYIIRWYGQKTKPHYGLVLDGARRGDPRSEADLIRLVRDRLLPAIVRATAMSQLRDYPSSDSLKVFEEGLTDAEPLVRMAAARFIPVQNNARHRRLLVPLLYDNVRAVRIEAAQALAALPEDIIQGPERHQYEQVLEDYRQAMLYTADFAASRHNLGNLYGNLGQPDKAEHHYRKAIEIDDQFYPAKVNLAMLYNQRGRNNEAEKLLRQVVAQHPDLYQVHYSLGLLLAEENRFEEATIYLGQAASGLPQRSRIHYNLGLLLQKLHRDVEAESALQRALAIEPNQPEYQYALAAFYLERRDWDKAEQMTLRLLETYPDRPDILKLLRIIESRK